MPIGAVPSRVLFPLLLIAGCGAPPTDSASPAVDGKSRGSEVEAAAGEDWFSERAVETGLRFVHENGMSRRFYYPEIMPPGVGLLDYDNDGDLDVYLVQGRGLGVPAEHSTAPLPKRAAPPTSRLYRNDLDVRPDGVQTLRFTDVTEESGLATGGYGMGVATGDFDNDGCVDLYLTGLERGALYRNGCDGTFAHVSRQSQIDDPGWSVSATFVDYNRDGWLDLFVGHYLDYRLEIDKVCAGPAGGRNYCPPQVYQAARSRLFRNNRDGTFRDVTVAAGMKDEFGPALGMVAADFDLDGWPDLYVANDGQENQLWINRRDGTFVNAGLLSGAALTADGKAEASMGVDAGDFDNDGDEDLVVTEKTGEGFNLFVNDGSGAFEDAGARSGMASASLPLTGFGAAWMDFDNDGWLDFLSVNGAIQALDGRPDDVFPYGQRKLLLRNLGNGRFENVSDRAGPAFQSEDVGRGAAFGDIDNDGDLDLLVGNDAGPAQLLLNNVGRRRHWLGVRLVGERASRDMLGARVAVLRKDKPTLQRRARADGSYASANDPRVLVGLGTSAEAPDVRVQWPGGRTEEWHAVPIDRYVTLKEGSGR